MSEEQVKQEHVVPVSALIRANSEIMKALQGSAQRGELPNLLALGVMQIVMFNLASAAGLTTDELTGVRPVGGV